jgi:hypothetical protein
MIGKIIKVLNILRQTNLPGKILKPKFKEGRQTGINYTLKEAHLNISSEPFTNSLVFKPTNASANVKDCLKN